MVGISYNEPPYLTPREFTISVISISNIIGVIPHGLSIGLAIAAKYYIEENKLKNYSVEQQIDNFQDEILRFFSSYKNKPEDALQGFIDYVHMIYSDKIISGYPIQIAIQNCVDAGEHYDWYLNEAIKAGLIR